MRTAASAARTTCLPTWTSPAGLWWRKWMTSPPLLEGIVRLGGPLLTSVSCQPYFADQDIPAVMERLASAGFVNVHTSSDTHADTAVADLSPSEEELLAATRKGHKSGIKKSLREGMEVAERRDEEAVREFILRRDQMFSSRMGAKGTRRLERHTAAIKGLIDRDLAFLLFAQHGGATLAGGLFLKSFERVIYYQGFSSDDDSPDNLPKATLLVWQAMLMAKRMGCALFDMGGVAFETEDPAMLMINRFKLGFRPVQQLFVGRHESRPRPGIAALERYVGRLLSRSRKNPHG